MVVLHLDEATDGKSLLGSYVCGDAPGEFRWQPGALAQSLAAGRWLVLEDVDAAPQEVLAALIPLLEGRSLMVPGRAEPLTPAAGFRLFGTISTRMGGTGGRPEPATARLWSRVTVAPPTHAELVDILRGLFPCAADLVEPMLSSLAAAQALCGQSITTSANGAFARIFSVGRDLTLRDAIKWGQRIVTMHGADIAACHDSGDVLPQRLREVAFLEGVDILGGMLPPGACRDAVLSAVAAAWSLPTDRAAHYEALHKPAFSAAGGVLCFGRARLDMHASAPAGLGTGYAMTGHAARTLERLAVATSCLEPVLLVGETGTGKTAAVQALARALGARLAVVNMSTQSDSADLLGGFKPREPGALCLPLVASFVRLFADTFPREPNSEFTARVVRCPSRALRSGCMPRAYTRPFSTPAANPIAAGIRSARAHS